MKIRPRNIPKFLGGNKFWYSNISSYDPTNYTWDYDTLAGLKKGDVRGGFKSPWASPTAGLDPGRYTPTDLSPEYGTMGLGLSHYTYTLGVEALPYYKEFTEALFDKNNKVTPVGMEYIKLSDALLPEGHNARILNPDGTIKDKITVTLKDAHRRSPQIKTFNLKNPEELKAYIEHVRNDLTVGGRHNVFPKVGKRYFYYDNDGNTHWVNPEEAKNYEMFDTPDEGFNDKSGVYWYDYQLKGPKKPGNSNGTPNSNRVPTSNGISSIIGEHTEKESVWPKILDQLRKYGPNLLAAGRLAGNLWNNERVFKESLAAIKPNLKGTYRTERQVVGDEATKQGFYKRAAQGLTAAARPFTSDADRQMAYLMEAKRVGDELRALGDLADNQEIRRTSDESNQHQWANILRATEVANANIEAMNYADALKHNLKALKYSADWTSIDNELLAKETRGLLKLARSENILNQIFALDEQLRISNDLEYNLLYDTMQEAWAQALKDNNNDAAKARLDPNFKEALKQFNYKNYLLKRESYLRMLNSPYYAKEGLKFSFKSNDSLLYKTTRDAVQHFLKMSKIASDSYNRKPVKILKLTSHPKGNTRKYLLGGAAPFTVYRPATLGGDSTMASQTGTTSTSSSKSSSSKGNDTLDMVKELFKLVAGKGLPSDVNSLYQSMLNFLTRASVFGQEISTEDIASMYLSQMQQLNLIQYLKANFDKAKDIAINNDALNEVAIDSAGRIAVLDIKNPGEIKFVKSLEEALKNNYTVLTNELLLNYRALIPLFAARTDLDGVVSNGVGLNKIAQYIKSIKPQLGTEELTKEGFTKVLAGKIQAGFELLQSAPDGDYKYTDYTKDLLEQMKLALLYISSVLPTNMRAVIQFHADLDGTTPNKILGSLLGSELNLEHNRTYSPMTGKAAKDSSGNSKSDGESTNSAGLAFVMGLGPRELLEFNTGTSYAAKVLGIKGTLQTNSLENLGQGATLLDATKSQLGGYLQWNKATFGGSRLNSGAYNHIILNDSTIMGVDLPYTRDINGNTIPDFLLLRKMELADEEIRKSNILNDDYSSINKIYLKYGLSPKYNQDGKLNQQNYMRFAAILATLDELSLLNKSAILSDEIALAGDVERDLYEQSMKKLNKNYSLSDGFFGLGKDNLYKGTIFIPYNEDIAFAAISSGKPLKQDIPNNVATVQLMQYAPATLKYKSPEITLSQIKNS